MHYIYIISNKINSKLYVGQTNNPRVRWKRHLRDSFKFILDLPINRAIRKYGEESFEMIVIEEFESVQECNDAEEFWIQFFQSTNKGIGYNISLGGNNRTQSLETRAKVSQALSGRTLSKEHKQKLSESKMGPLNPMFGKSHTEEHKRKLSESLSRERNPMFGKHHTAEQNARQSARQKGQPSPKKGKKYGPLSDQHKQKLAIAFQGEKSVNALLTDAKVKEIKILLRDDTMTKKAIAERYGVAPSTISAIARGASWTHIII